MMSDIAFKDGYIPLDVQGVKKSCSTYYKVFGDLSCGKPPVVCLHGGPGAGHGILQDFAIFWPRHGLPVIVYDMIGCGKSTNLDDEKAGDESFWQMSLFVFELGNLLDFFRLREHGGPGYSLLGLSFGSMLGAEFAVTRPEGLRKLVLGNPVSSMDTFNRGVELWIEQLPLDAQKVITDGVKTRNTNTDAFRNAFRLYVERFICRANPLPAAFDGFTKIITTLDIKVDTTLPTMFGTTIPMTEETMGSLRGWTVIPRLHRISVPTLIWNGEFDHTHNITVQPLFDNIPRVRWVTIAGAGHVPTYESEERREAVFKLNGEFLA